MNEEEANLEAYFKEGLRKLHAEEEAPDVKAWCYRRLDEMGGGAQTAIMTWLESFDFTDEMLRKFEALAKLKPEERKILDYPWTSWNKFIEPLEAGLLGVITAPDGMGKTVYAECLAEHWANKRNYVAYVHYELNKSVMMQRRLARHALVCVRDIRNGKMTGEQREKIAWVRTKLSEWEGQITYVHAPGWTMERTVEELRRLRAEDHCDVVVVDYLEKVAASPRQIKMRLEWYQREADNVEQLKNFAEAAGIPVIMVTQMRKDAKSKDMDKVDRGSIRGAGEKSEKANLVVMLNRKRESDGYANEIDVLVDKNTMGRAGVQFQQWIEPEYFKVTDLR